MGKAEAHEELFRRPVEDRAAYDGLPARRGDQALFEECLDDSRDVYAANFLDLRAGDGLAVGNHGERFERRHRQTQWRAQAFDESANDVMVLRLGVELEAASDGADFDAAVLRA